MVDMEKRQAGGDLGEEEMKKLEMELSGTLLLVAWKGSKFELSAVLRQVVDMGALLLCSAAGARPSHRSSSRLIFIPVQPSRRSRPRSPTLS